MFLQNFFPDTIMRICYVFPIIHIRKKKFSNSHIIELDTVSLVLIVYGLAPAVFSMISRLRKMIWF
jgi:hypothetical protein